MKRLLVFLLMIWMSWGLAPGAAAQEQTTVRVKDVLKKVAPSLVKVVAESGKIYVGTGIAIKKNLVLTSVLLARGPEARLTVVDTENHRFKAKIRGLDPETSMALLEVESASLQPIQMTDSIEVGDWVALVGAFYEQFPAIQQGVASSVTDNAIIINAAAVPGSAGGAVVNKDGKLVAVIRGRFGFAMAPDLLVRENSGEMVFRSPKARSGELCFAVPVHRVREVSGQLERSGRVRRGWLGLYLMWSRPDNTVRVTRVIGDSPAYRGGVRKNDRVLSVNGRDVTAITDVFAAVRDLSPGAPLKLDVQRDRLRKTLLITMGTRPESARSPNSAMWTRETLPPENSEIAVDFHEILPGFQRFILQSGHEPSLGLDFRSVTRRNSADPPEGGSSSGLLVTGVLREGPAARAGFRRGDRLMTIGGRKVSSPDDVRKAILSHRSGDKIDVMIQRDGGLKKLDLVVNPTEVNGYNWSRFRNQMKGMSVEVYDRSLQQIKGEMDRLNWRMELLERHFQKSSPEDLQQMLAGLESLKTRAVEVLNRREAQLESDRKDLDNNFKGIRKRLDVIGKKLKDQKR